MKDLASALEKFAKIAAEEGIGKKPEPAPAKMASVPVPQAPKKRGRPPKPTEKEHAQKLEDALSQVEGDLTQENLDTLEAAIKAFPMQPKGEKKPVQAAPVQATPPRPAPVKLDIPKGALARLGPKAAAPGAPQKVAPIPKADTRSLEKVPPSEAAPYEDRLSKMSTTDIEALLSQEMRPWQSELVKVELERRKGVEMQKKYADKPVIEILLDAGEIPHNLLRKEPAWAAGPNETIEYGVKNMDVRLIRALSDYYNRLEKMGDLNDNEKYAAKAMRDRIWDDEIGTYSVDEMPLLPEDMDKLSNMEIPLMDGSMVNPLEVSNRELAEALYLMGGGGSTYGDFTGGPFDRESKERSPLIDDIKIRFEGSAYTQNNPAAVVERIETPLASKALLKRLLYGRNVSIKLIKDRKGKAELLEAENLAYMPPIYDTLKVYYKPEFKTMDVSDAKEILFKMNPEELHNTYQLYYLMKSKSMLDKREESMEHEMEELLEKFKELNVISEIHRPRTRPPPKITGDEFGKYVEIVSTLYGELPEESVKNLLNRPDEEILFRVLTTGTGTDEEKKLFVNVMDDLMAESLTGEKMGQFFGTPEGKHYYKVFERYGEM